MDSAPGLCQISQKVCEFVKKQRRAWKAGIQLLMHAGPHAADLHANYLARKDIDSAGQTQTVLATVSFFLSPFPPCLSSSTSLSP